MGVADMAVNLNGSRRLWSDGDVVCLRDEGPSGEPVVRQFWVPPGGGYVREVDAQHPGVLGQQVCVKLANRGSTLSADRKGLLGLIRREYRRRAASASA